MDGEFVVAAASNRVDRKDMAERSLEERPCFVGGVLRAVRRRAFVPGAKSGGSPASPSLEAERRGGQLSSRRVAARRRRVYCAAGR